MLSPLKKLATMPVHIVYCPCSLGLVPGALSHIGVDFGIPIKVSSIDDAKCLLLAYLANIMVNPLFLSWVG